VREAVLAAKKWLDEHNGTSEHETTLRILKLVEEVGEVSRARIGALGQNPRKGVTNDSRKIAEELADCIITAAVAIESLGFHHDRLITLTADKILDRVRS